MKQLTGSADGPKSLSTGDVVLSCGRLEYVIVEA